MNPEAVIDPCPFQDYPAGPHGLGQVIATLSRQLNAERIGVGALAELRRLKGNDLRSAFWKRYLCDVPAEWREPRGQVDARVDRAWAGLIRAMVEMAP